MNDPKVFAVRGAEARRLQEIRDGHRDQRARGRQEGFALGVIFCVVAVVLVFALAPGGVTVGVF